MFTRTIPSDASGITTSALGFGCASLFAEPDPRVRQRLLDQAYDLGITHFDVAPMYGMGRAERELGRFAATRRENVVIVTKFGIDVTLTGRLLGRVQRPVRQILARAGGARSQLRERAANSSSGSLGRLLYRDAGFSIDAAARSLRHSLEALRTDYVDVLLLHDPPASLSSIDHVCEALEELKTAGRIRAWGLTGKPGTVSSLAARIGTRTFVTQVHDDELTAGGETGDHTRLRRDVVYGVLSSVVPAIVAHVGADQARSRRWAEAVGVDCASTGAVASLLLARAVRQHPKSVVLFGSTRPAHLGVAVEAVSGPDRRDALDAFEALLRTELLGGPRT